MVLPLLNKHCCRFGHRWETLRIDMGSVENGQDFISALDTLNEDRKEPGVKWIPANVDCQEQNPVERYIQTLDNNENANFVASDIVPASAWALCTLSVVNTMNHVENELTRGTTPIMAFEQIPTDLRYMFQIGWGKPVICTRVRRVKGHKMPGDTRNQFGICVGHGRAWGSIWVLFLDGNRHWNICMRKHAREIVLGVKKQQTVEEGKLYMTTRDEEGKTVLVARGDTGILGKQFAFISEEPLGPEPNSTLGDVRIKAMDSSITYLNITEDMEERIQQEIESKGPEYMAEEQYEDIHIDSTSGRLMNQIGEIVVPEEGAGKHYSQVPMSALPGRSQRTAKGRRLPDRYVIHAAKTAYTALVTVLFMAGLALTNQSIDNCPRYTKSELDESMFDVEPEHYTANIAVSHEEYNRKNPKWSKAIKRDDAAKWVEADAKERAQQLLKRPGRDDPTMEPVDRGKAGVPYGEKIYPIKRHCKIKSDGRYKVRWVVLGNLDDYQGDTYSPTASRKTVWLVFALSITLGLYRRFFDITGAFMAEKPTRDIYVTIDDEVYILRYSLYGLKDAPKLFNDGLVKHLKNGGYEQSRWDQCLFYKKLSTKSYIYMVFHVDDFIVTATSEELIDKFHDHMRIKYEITSNHDGIFLSILMQPLGNDAYLMTKPTQLQNIFDKDIPGGPTLSTAPREPIQTSYLKTFVKEDSPSVDKTEFRSMLGAVMQLTDVRPDVAFAISKISQRQSNPRVKDHEALTYLINYLYHTRDRGVVLRQSKLHQGAQWLKLRGFSDCSYVCHDNGKSQYCICFDLVDEQEHPDDSVPYRAGTTVTGMFQLKSFMAPTVDLSSCEGEIGAAVELSKDTVFYRGILRELGQEQMQPTPLYGDNDSTMSLATKFNNNHKRVRYMLPKIHWLMEQTNAQVVRFFRLGTKELPADLGTKHSTGNEWVHKRSSVFGDR